MTTDVWAVVPVKDLVNAKQRLSSALDAAQRAALLRAMLHDVLTALTASPCLAGVAVLTRDGEVSEIAGRFDVQVLSEPDNSGHTAAVTRAATALVARGTGSMLTIPADLPLVTPQDIDTLVRAHTPSRPALTIAPARDRQGSNAMLCSPPDALPFRFGENSFYPHLQRARGLGIEPGIVERPGLGLDIDTPEDLGLFAAEPSATHAYDYLSRAGLIADLTSLSRAACQP